MRLAGRPGRPGLARVLSGILAGLATLMLAFLPVIKYWAGTDPADRDPVIGYVYCAVTYVIPEGQFEAMVSVYWACLALFVLANFRGDARRTMLLIIGMHSVLHYLVGRTFWRHDVHMTALVVLALSTVALFIWSRRWSWLLLAGFVLPGLIAIGVNTAFGGARTDDPPESGTLRFYLAMTHLPALILAGWFVAVPLLPPSKPALARE